MGLQVWLPLNGGTHNQGLDDKAVTSRGIVYGTGKIAGQGAKFNGDSNQYIHVGSTGDFQYDEFTWSVWIYPTSFSTTQNHIISNGRDYNKYGFNLLIYNKNLSITSDISGGAGFIATLTENTWYHIAISLKGNTIKCYLNGNLAKTFTSDSKLNYSESSGLTIGKMSYSYGSTTAYFPFNGIIQDVRIYDEALSPKQVKLLSQGLVCHYPMGNIDGKIGGRNLLQNSRNLASLSLKDTLAKVERTDTNCKLSLASGASSSSWYAIYTDFTIEKNQSYTASIEIEVVNLVSGSKGCHFTAAKIPPNSSWNDFAEIDFKTPGKYHYTFNSGENTSVRIALGVQGDGSSNYVIAKNLKLEKGTSATPWTPAPEDAAYMYDNIIYDTSGYENNGSVSGTIAWDNDSPRYKGAYGFNTSSNFPYIKINPMTLTDMASSYSFCWWGKNTRDASMYWGFSDGNILNMYQDNNHLYWNIGDSYQNPFYSPDTVTEVNSFLDGKWHFYCITGDGNKTRLYVNGKLYGIAKNYRELTGTTIYINSWGRNTNNLNYPILGSISDFRIYSTALSDADILDLYQTSASVDNNGNLLLAGEVIEE